MLNVYCTSKMLFLAVFINGSSYHAQIISKFIGQTQQAHSLHHKCNKVH